MESTLFFEPCRGMPVSSLNSETGTSERLSGRTSSPNFYTIMVRALALFVPIGALIALVIVLIFVQNRANERALRELEAMQAVTRQADIISTEFTSIVSDLLYLANQVALQSYFSEPTPERRVRLERDYELFISRKGIYDQVRYLDVSGMEVVRVNYGPENPEVVPAEMMQDKADRDYVQVAHLNRDEVYISSFDFNIEDGQVEQPLKPMIRFATPVFDSQQRRMGVLVLNYLGRRPIRRIEELSTRVSGSLILINEDGFWLRGEQVNGEWEFRLNSDRTFGSDYPDAWQRIVLAEQGQFLADQGLFTFRKVPILSESGMIPSGGGPETIRNAPSLTVVSFVPNNTLYRRSNTLLGQLLIVYVVVSFFLIVLLWLLSTAMVVRREAQQRLEESEVRLRTLSASLLTAQEDERRTISRDLHDDLGQLVTAICLDLERGLIVTVDSKKESIVRLALEKTQSLLDKVHEISAKLRPRILDDLGLQDAARSLVRDFKDRTGIELRLEMKFDHHNVPQEISQNVYRILQEALNNVAKYAGTERAVVHLNVHTNGVELDVCDEGMGFCLDELNGATLGILGMRERAELLGGTFQIITAPGEGTEIHVSIPLREMAHGPKG